MSMILHKTIHETAKIAYNHLFLHADIFFWGDGTQISHFFLKRLVTHNKLITTSQVLHVTSRILKKRWFRNCIQWLWKYWYLINNIFYFHWVTNYTEKMQGFITAENKRRTKVFIPCFAVDIPGFLVVVLIYGELSIFLLNSLLWDLAK